MNKLRILCTALVFFYIGGTMCGLPAQSLPDSVITDDNVYRYMFSDTKKAESIMTALRERKKLPDWELDYTEGDLYYNTGRYYRALKCYTRVLDSNRAKKDEALSMDILHRIISCHDMTHNEARKAECMNLLLHKAEACGDKAMQAVALFNIGKSQYNQGNREEGYRHMEQAARMMEMTDYKNKYDNLRYHYNTLLTYYEQDQRGKDALRTLDALEKVVTASTGQESATVEGLDKKERKALYGHRTVVFNMLNRTAEADTCYRRFLSLGKPTDRYNYLVMPYLFDRRRYDEIFRISHLREHIFQEHGDTVNYHMTTICKNLGQAYFETGNYREAALHFKRLAVLRDSIKNREQQSAVLELAEVHESGEKDKIIIRQQMHTHILLAVVVFVLVAVIVVVSYNRKIRRRNVSLVRAVRESLAVRDELLLKEEEHRRLKEQIEEQTRQTEELNRKSDIDRKATPPDASPAEADVEKTAREKEQLEQAIYEINSRKLYLQPGLTQKDVLQMVRVPAYLFGAIFKRHTGESFTEYITRKRMEYAAKLLIEHPEYTIEAVAGMCGIQSKQHFHRLFLDFSELTPSAFRKANEHIENK